MMDFTRGDGLDAFDLCFDLPTPDDDLLEFLELDGPASGELPPPLQLGDASVCDSGGFGVDERLEGVIDEDEAMVPARSQLDCSGCHILREVIHTNGEKNMKLVIHGGPGVFYHAMIDNFPNLEGYPVVINQSYFDFSAQSFNAVQQFLMEYSQLRTRDGYIVVQDTISDFCNVLCTKMSNDEAHTSTDTPCLQETVSPYLFYEEANNHREPMRNPRTGIAAQRERTGKLRLKDLAEVFHLTIAEASKILDICPTAIKKICRKHGMARWPYRKIKSIDKMMLKLQQELVASTGPEALSILAEIQRLKEKRQQICEGRLSQEV